MEQTPEIIVIGGINVDISGKVSGKMVHGDSNPGHVRETLGGVGRNIAENLARLGCRVAMLGVLGDDANGRMARTGCEALGLDMSHVFTVPGGRTGTYVILTDGTGDLYAAVNDMDIYEELTPERIGPCLDWINSAGAVVIDANIPRETVNWLAEHCIVPLYGDPVSTPKAERFRDSLGRFAAIKPNAAEAALLSGVMIDGYIGLDRAAERFLESGMKRIFISLGSAGVYYADGEKHGIRPICPGDPVNTSGCGDAFLAAAVCALTRGKNTEEAAAIGQAAAAVCAESESAVSPEMSWQALLDRMEE